MGNSQHLSKEFPKKVSYPWQCSAMCCRKASSEATWPEWSLYSNFRKFINKEVTALGGQIAARKLALVFAFENFVGDDHVATTYALLGDMVMSPKMCHWVILSPLDEGPVRSEGEHVGITLQFDREPWVETLRDDVPKCLGKVIEGAGKLGPLSVYQGDELAAKLANTSGTITTRLLSFVWCDDTRIRCSSELIRWSECTL